jgi:hypothetical protein
MLSAIASGCHESAAVHLFIEGSNPPRSTDLDQVPDTSDAVEPPEDSLRHLLEVVGRQDAVDDDDGIRDLTPQPPEGGIAARPEEDQGSGTQAIIPLSAEATG